MPKHTDPRRRIVKAIIGAGVLVTLLIATGLVTFAWLADDTRDTVNAAKDARTASSQPSADTATLCTDLARRWTTTLLDDDLAPDVWAARMSEMTDPAAVQTLSGIDRNTTPAATITDVKAAAQPGSCDVDVTLSNGDTLGIEEQITADAKWRVTGWTQ